jgi:hypothetical protein
MAPSHHKSSIVAYLPYRQGRQPLANIFDEMAELPYQSRQLLRVNLVSNADRSIAYLVAKKTRGKHLILATIDGLRKRLALHVFEHLAAMLYKGRISRSSTATLNP